MNPVLSTILNRRTTRKFTQEPLKQTQIEQIVEAGQFAPSGHNCQPWHFTVIQNETILQQMNADAKEVAKAHPDEMIRKMANNEALNLFYGAPVLIVVSGTESGAVTLREDCAAATQNMLLAAESLGIGSCWNGMVGMLFNSPKGSEYAAKFRLPESYKPLYAVALGHKAVTATGAPARKAGTVTFID